MGLIGRLVRANCYSMQQGRRVFQRMRAAIQKAAVKSGLKRQQLNFQYDPSSYALNFDDGCCRSGDIDRGFLQNEYYTCVYVIKVVES
ncbi:hypothetical protein AgCh_020336 [Apium graveolens]